MAQRPYQQATRPDRARQRDTRSRSFVAGVVVVLSVVAVAGALLLAPHGGEPALGAEGVAGRTPPVTAGLMARLQPDHATAAVVDAPRLVPYRPVYPDRVEVALASIAPTTSAGPDAIALPAASGTIAASGLPSADPLASGSASSAPAPSSGYMSLPEPLPVPPPTGPAASARPGARPLTTAPTSAEPEDLKGYTWPLYHGRMTTFFGPSDSGFLVVDGQRIHPGLDSTTWCGDRVRAAHAGVVVAVGRRFANEVGFAGSLDAFYKRIERRHSIGLQPIVVVVDDGNGYRSMYVHLSKALVHVGDKVRRHMAIGLEGDTGNANGCHLHYELVRMDGPWMRVAGDLVKEHGYPVWERERVDPLRVLDLKVKRAGRFVPGILRPKLPPSLRPTRSPSP